MESKILGTLYGHAFGDASGGRLEFRGVPSHHEIKKAMELVGGGVFKLAPGQVTDDGELTLQVFRALYTYFMLESETGVEIDDLIFQNFKMWMDSNPFDIGSTTKNAFHDAKTKYEMVENVNALNVNSESNGALMRCAPYAIFAYIFEFTDKELYDFIEMDVKFTHVKQCVVNLVYAYCIIILSILKGYDNDTIYLKLVEISNTLDDLKLAQLVECTITHPDVTKNIGWDKNAFSLVLYCLFNNFSFEHAIEYTLSLGGDTDTNAAIVGAVMGAKYGIDSVPNVDKIYNCKPNHGRQNLHPVEYLEKVPLLIDFSEKMKSTLF